MPFSRPLKFALAPLLLAVATASWGDPLADLVAGALADENRPAADKARDDNRKPLETLQFFGMEPDMRVLELVPGGGWYTRVLAPVLRDSGKLYVALGTGRIEDSLLQQPGFEQVTVLDVDTEGEVMDFGVEDIDLALTFRNMHNFDAERRDAINKGVYNALKPGGFYGVVDHTRRHMEPDSRANSRRVDPVLMIHELQSLGFELVNFTDLHYRDVDGLDLEVGHEDVTGQTDRFTLLFRKPE